MRKLRRQLKDSSKNAESLTVVLTMQEAASASKVMEPTKAGSLEGDAKKTFLDEYRLAMCDMQKQLLDLEKLLIQGKNDEAQELYQKINQSQRPAHKKFRD
ncbi:MAG: cytochrome b562, partial [Planctomycetota bacterium]